MTQAENQSQVLEAYTLLQIAAEQMFGRESEDAVSKPEVTGPINPRWLTAGNGKERGTRMTTQQAATFASEWSVVSHRPNTASGFSGTIFKYLGPDDSDRGLTTGQLVVSMRSTEFADDSARDTEATDILEVSKGGWAFGQIADMQAWFEQAKVEHSEDFAAAGGKVTVTGYSLGGHLATAFYDLYGINTVDQVYTFNGAGVGRVKAGTNLNTVIQNFVKWRDEGNGFFFRDAQASAKYLALVSSYQAGSSVSAAGAERDWKSVDTLLKEAEQAAKEAGLTTSESVVELKLLADALDRIRMVALEAERAPTVASARGANFSPANVSGTENIAALRLDYQLAVLRSMQSTSAVDTGLIDSLIVAYREGRKIEDQQANFYDVYGAGTPSAVSNSQIHRGEATPVYIEDQPLLRGTVNGVIKETVRSKWEIKLLANQWELNDFGDTHSILLVEDSLRLQSALTQLAPTAGQGTLNALLQAASKEVAYTEAGGQGKAEGDSLENLLDAARRLLLGQNASKTSSAVNILEGGTWNDKDARQSFEDSINELLSAGTSLKGKLTLKVSGDDLDGRGKFGDFAALYSLSPVVFDGVDQNATDALLAKQRASWASKYSQWNSDQQLSATARENGEATITDQWLSDRKSLLTALLARNASNTPDSQPNGRSAANANYQDVTSGRSFDEGKTADYDSTRHVIFDSKDGNSLFGGGLGDHIYGMDGGDAIQGYGGDDYLEGNDGSDDLSGGEDRDTLVGGAGDDILNGGRGDDLLNGGEGADTYVFDANWGADTIIDVDGQGSLQVAGLIGGLPVGIKTRMDGVWMSADQKVTYAYNTDGTALVIRFNDPALKGNSIQIRGWTPSKNLGITLGDTPPAFTASLTVIGDYQKGRPDSNGYVNLGSQLNAPDVLLGSDDYLHSDLLVGLGGNDGIQGFSGNDSIDGGEGSDLLLGGWGDDTLVGGGGNDVIFGAAQGAIANPGTAANGQLEYELPAPAANEELVSQGYSWEVLRSNVPRRGTDGTIHFRAVAAAGAALTPYGIDYNTGNYVVPRDHDVIDAGAGDDFVGAGTGDDVAHGGDGNDEIWGLDGNDILYGDAGDDWIKGDGFQTLANSADGSLYTPLDHVGDDLLFGGDGNDALGGDGGDDSLYGGTGNDSLFGDANSENGVDAAALAFGNDYLDGEDGDDLMQGDRGDDTLLGGTGSDVLLGDAAAAINEGSLDGRDLLDGGAGSDTLSGGGGSDTLSGGVGDDLLFGDLGVEGLSLANTGADLLDGGAGNDSLDGGGGSDTLLGGDGDDALYGDGSLVSETDGSGDFLDGGAGNDTLFGEGGSDFLRGGAGQDQLLGDSGNDTLIGGSGVDALQGGLGDDVYIFSAGDATRDGNGTAESIDDKLGANLIVLEGAAPESLIVRTDGQGQLVLDYSQGERLVLVGGVGGSRNTFQLGDGKVYSQSQLVGRFGIGVIRASFSADQLALSSTTEDDLAGDALASSVLPEKSSEPTMKLALAPTSTSTQASVTAPNVTFYLGGNTDDLINAPEGNAVISGGLGEDTLAGAGGGNAYLYSLGDGSDTIYDSSTTATGAAANNKIVFGAGISRSDLRVLGATGSLTIQVGANEDDHITLTGFNQALSFNAPIALFEFQDGSTMTYAELIDQGLVGSDNNDVISGTSLGDRLEGSAGNDTLAGANGNDTLLGGAGADSISGEAGNDRLDGGSGDDTLRGGDGADVYVFGPGYGNDRIVNADADAFGVSGDSIQMADGVMPTDVEARRSNNDLVLRLYTTNERLVVQDYFLIDAASPSAVESILFANGVIWTPSDIKVAVNQASLGADNLLGYSSNDSILGADGRDTLVGNGGADTLSGGRAGDSLTGGDGSDQLMGDEGDDTLAGDAGADTLTGGAGSDLLFGGDGADVYVFGRGSGRDAISNYDSDAFGVSADTIKLEGSVLPSDVTLARHGTSNALYLSIAGTRDVLTVSEYFQSDATTPYAVETISFADGTSWSSADILARTVTLAQDQSIYANGASSLVGGDGNDYLEGSQYNDTLDGAGGDDDLDGRQGNDTYKFGRGSGNDSVWEASGGTDVVLLGTGISTSDVKLQRNGVDLVLSIAGDSSTLSIKNFYGNTLSIVPNSVESIKFVDSTVWNIATINSMVMQETTPDADLLIGTSALLNVLSGAAGADTLLGGSLADQLDGGSGEDSIEGGAGDDILFGDGEADTLRGASGADSLYGGAGSDFLDGGDGDDTLDGGLGDDGLYGGLGNNTYHFDIGSGRDTIGIASDSQDALQSRDRIELGAGLSSGDIDVTRHGTSSWTLSIKGRGDTLTINGASTSKPFDVVFADGSTWDLSSLDVASQSGTEGGDLFDFSQAGSSSISIGGLGGDDTLLAASGADTLDGGAGNDSLDGGHGADLLLGGAGADSLQGSFGNDTLLGNGGDDVLQGGAGSDLYVYGIGDGNDMISVDQNAVPYPHYDRLLFGPGIDSADVIASVAMNRIFVIGGGVISQPTSDLKLQGWQGGGSVTVGMFYDFSAGANGPKEIDEFEFADGSVWEAAWVYKGLGSAIKGTASSDLLTANSGERLYGYSGNDQLTGDAGSNWLDGGAGADTLSGGAGDDVYVVDSSADVVAEGADEGSDNVESLVSYTLGDNLENLRLIGDSWINGVGNVLNNRLIGNGGSNLLDGGLGADTLEGRGGDDVYVIDSLEDQVIEYEGDGFDTIMASISYVLPEIFTQYGTRPAEIEGLTLTGTSTINGMGNSLDNSLIGNAGANRLDGGSGMDTMVGGAGDDTYVVDNTGDIVVEAAGEGVDSVEASVSYEISDGVENLTLQGGADIDGTGNALDNVLTGTFGKNRLNGGEGADTMIGGAGDDTYVVDNVADLVVEAVGDGTDTIETSLTLALGAELENLTLIGNASINGFGNAAANKLRGNGGNNLLDGGSGTDTMVGGAGNDSYVVDATGDVVTEAAGEGIDSVTSSATFTLSANVENLQLVGISAINGTGNSLDNVLTGNSGANKLTGGAGNDTLDGGAGNDTLLGGTGNDSYFVDATSDVITENSSEGTDSVTSTATYTLGANVENLTLAGSAAINATGNTLANFLTGNSAPNRIDGGTGADTLIGGGGNDTYVVDNIGDVITEASSGGTDSVESNITWVLGAELENLTLTGTGSINGTGNLLNNVLTGNSGANRLDGGLGSDTMSGGSGNDTYVVDSSLDVVVETASAGTDTVESSVTWTLGSDVENLTLTGTSNINGTGNGVANTLRGNAGDNVLTGGVGNDTMIGGAGNDTYYVDATTDVVTELTNEGLDTVYSSVTLTSLANFVENMTLTGTSALNATGNSLDNVLTGNSGSNNLSGGSGNDTLNGGAGADTLVGGLGDDTFIVDSTSDVVTEASAQGVDTVMTSVTLATLASNVENLTLTGSANLNATGNTLDNVLTGNGGSNTLTGGAGADTLDGQGGNDTLNGGAGADSYLFGLGYGADLIIDTDSTAGVKDVVRFGAGIAQSDIRFTQSGNALVATIGSTSESLTIQDWYLGTQNRVEEFRFTDGTVLTNVQAQALVGAMATFSPGAAMSTTGSAEPHASSPALGVSGSSFWHGIRLLAA